MLKLKKIIRSAVCFMVLLAFAGTISLESIPGKIKNTRDEVSVLNTHDSFHFMALSEENDNDETHDACLDLMEFPVFASSGFDFNKTLLHLYSSSFTKKPLSLPLYLNNRCLRL